MFQYSWGILVCLQRLQFGNIVGRKRPLDDSELCVLIVHKSKPEAKIRGNVVGQFGFSLGLTLNLTQAHWRLQAQTELVFWPNFLLQTFGQALGKGQPVQI